jgi:ATP synthase protein I
LKLTVEGGEMVRKSTMTKPQRVVIRLIALQMALTVVLAIILGLTMDVKAMYSALIAGYICVQANAIFAWRVLRFHGARQARQFAMAFMVGEVAKLVIMGALFVVALLFFDLNMKAFMIAFAMNLGVFWLAPFIYRGP